MAASRRAVLVGADPLALRGLRDHLIALCNLAIVAEATTAQEAVSAVAAHRPHLLFFQPERFPNAGLDVIAAVRTRWPSAKLLIVTHRADIDAIFAYAMLGVAAYLLDDNLADLVEGVEAVVAGRILLGRRLIRSLASIAATPFGRAVLAAVQSELAHAAHGVAEQSSHAGTRLDAILRLVAQGLTNKQIARMLGIRESTVAEHLKRYRAKVGPVPRVALGRMLAEDHPA